MTRKYRPATLKVVYRPRLARVVVLYRGKVQCRCHSYEDAQAFVTGWRKGEAKVEAERAAGLSQF